MSETIKTGDVVEVGEFFWIGRENLIGFDRDAQHGHDSRHAGSVDESCTLTVRGVSDGRAIVRLNRPHVPYGAPAAIGTVFAIPVSKLEAWPDMVKQRKEKESARRVLAKEYCR